MTELSVIIPSFNRAGPLQACLEALCRQTQRPENFEVIVVVDGSTDETMTMLARFEAPYRLRSFWQENAGQASARNRGIAEADGRYCLFVDDDIVASAELVAEHLRAQRAMENVLAVGQLTIELLGSADWYARAFAEGWREHYTALNEGTASPSWEDCYGGNVSAPREVLRNCGGFATEMARGHDIELGYRLFKAGCTVVYLPDAVGRQDERKGFRALSRDAENAGFTAAANYQRNADMLSQTLASFSTGGWRKLLLRRLVLAMRVHPRLLALCGRLIRSPARRRSWYAFVQNICYCRGARRASAGTDLWARLTSGTPILLYHAVGGPSEVPSPYVMPVNRFDRQMRWIRRFGYRPISLDDFVRCQRDRQFPPARSVVITFDDGYADNHEHAYPVLTRYEMPATIFLVTEYVGTANRWDANGALAGRPIMHWTQMKELAENGVEFGAHSRTHARLTELPPDQALAEIAGSREEIERHLGQPVPAFAYPYGLHNAGLQSMVDQAGFLVGCTVDPGLNGPMTPAAALHRSEICGTDSIFRLWCALWLGDSEAIWRRKRF